MARRHLLCTLFAASAALQAPQYRCRPNAAPRATVAAAEPPPPAARGPGWSTSVEEDAELLYMPFLEHQLALLDKLGAVEEHGALTPELGYATKAKAKTDGLAARVGSRVFSVPGAFRRVRMTYFDGGHSLQVFNSLWYPALDRADAPLLGIDLLRFGPKKFLCVVDAQPPGGRSPDDGSVPHDTSALDAVRGDPKNEELRGEVSSKWYDDNRFFSGQMLYGRFDRGAEAVDDTLFPAFVAYLAAYVDLVKTCDVDADGAAAASAAHADYDVFNAARDPAHGLFTSYFGADWANDFVHDFLFEQSEAAEEEALS